MGAALCLGAEEVPHRLRATISLADGYRFAKRHGKPNPRTIENPNETGTPP